MPGEENPSRRDFLKKAVVSTVAVASVGKLGGVRAAPRKRPPNVLLILVDDLGYGDLSCYGAEDLRTPHIDGLFERGMRFDAFYANSPVCSPTRASLLTGRYPDLVGVPGVIRTHWTDSFGYLSRQAVLLPEVLRRVGYHTAIVGKWHLGLEKPNLPNDRGFDLFRGFLGDMMDDYYTHRRHGLNYMRHNRQVVNPKGHATDIFTEWALEYLRERARSRAPFFLYLAYNAPHAPIQPPREWLERVKKREPDLPEKRAKMVALIEHLDASVGRVLTELEKLGLSENTLVVFVSDNGGSVRAGASMGPLSGQKGQMLEGGIRVPACVVWPGKIEPGARTGEVALTMDLFPTLCEAAGAPVPREVDGVSLLPLLLGREAKLPERTLFWVRREGGRFNGRAFYAVRRGPWKLLQNSPFQPPRLYNLEDDPREEHPLDSKHPVYRELSAALLRHVIRAGAVPWSQPPS